MRWFLVAIPIFAAACGQTSSSGGNRDGGADATVSDAQSSFVMPDVPPGCPPDAGNENGIGKPCTATGSECTGSLKCLCQNWYGYQMPTGMPCFCTIVTYGNNNCTGCGSNAPCCSYNIPINGETISVSACFPSACLYGNQCPALTQ